VSCTTIVCTQLLVLPHWSVAVHVAKLLSSSRTYCSQRRCSEWLLDRDILGGGDSSSVGGRAGAALQHQVGRTLDRGLGGVLHGDGLHATVRVAHSSVAVQVRKITLVKPHLLLTESL